MNRLQRIEKLTAGIPLLSEYRLELVDKIVEVFNQSIQITISSSSNLITNSIATDFGDILRLHHCFSRESFSKDKFEYALESVLKISNVSACLAKRGQRGFDITINGEKVSLKTEAAAKIRIGFIHISKFMELGSGDWGKNPADLIGLRGQFLNALSSFDRLLMLRALKKGNPDYVYELIEIPLQLLKESRSGELEMKLDSKQFPKPGYCYVPSKETPNYSLYFDGGGERKLQIKNLDKKHCRVHASWKFKPAKRI